MPGPRPLSHCERRACFFLLLPPRIAEQRPDVISRMGTGACFDPSPASASTGGRRHPRAGSRPRGSRTAKPVRAVRLGLRRGAGPAAREGGPRCSRAHSGESISSTGWRAWRDATVPRGVRTGRPDRHEGEGGVLPKLTHRQRADRLAFLLQIARDLGRFSRDEDADRLLRHVHRGIGTILASDLGFVWRIRRGTTIEAAYHLIWSSKGEQVRARRLPANLREQAIRFAVERKSLGDPHILFTAVDVAGRPAAVLAFIRQGRRFGRQDAGFAADAAEILGHHLEERDRERAQEIRERIVRKVLLQLRPADILYQVLHGLKRLIHYDHSASVQTVGPSRGSLVIRAETIAWTKGKSPRIGRTIHLDADALEWISRLDCCVVVDPAAAKEGDPATMLGDLARISGEAPTPRSMIVAALRRDREIVGVLAVRARDPGAFVPVDLATIDSFLEILSASAFHAEVFRQQQDRLIEAERRTALGNIARAISHDLSNAFGVIQPLLEKLRTDIEEGTITPENLKRDVETLDQYVGISLRIFQGLLSFARGGSDGIVSVDLGASCDSVLALLGRGLRAQGIEVVRDLPAGLPPIQAQRQDCEQILLNLITNASESMPTGGTLTIRGSVERDGGARAGEFLHLTVSDTGGGIPARLIERVFEPFFTTKSGGTGLGLDICRSLVWEYDGTIWLESVEGSGSTAHVRIPIRPAAGGGPSVAEEGDEE